MRTRAFFLAVLFAAASVLGAPAQAQTSSEIVDQCLDGGGSPSMCWGLHGLLRTIGGLCRDTTMENAPCELVDGVTISEALVAAHEHSWLAQTLRYQQGLDDHRPLHDELWPHTHNSFNADAYDFQALGGLDSNQIYTVGDQLRMGIRAIELDIHWFPHLGWSGATPSDGVSGSRGAVQVCHGEPIDTPVGVYHLGCELNSPLLSEHLEEIRAWLDANPNEVIMIYLENTLDGVEAAHNEAAAAIEAAFGDLVLKPTSDCGTLPFDTSRASIRDDAGKRVLITGNCGPGAWGAWVHERGRPRWNESGLDYGDDFTPERCAAESEASVGNWIRHYGDETGLSAGAGTGGDVTTNDALGMIRCGTNMAGMDNLAPFDERLAQFAWSWDDEQPTSNSDGWCATHNANGRFEVADCTASSVALPYACFDGSKWSITAKADRWDLGEETCAAEGLGAFEVPWSGFENERLKAAKAAGAGPLWLDYHAAGGTWVR